MIKVINRIIAVTVIFCLAFEQSGFAQVAPQMPIPAYINGYVAPDRFRPVQLRSISFDSVKQDFALYLDKGDEAKAKPAQLSDAGKTLMQYFEIGLAMPNSYFWVNLRPDAPDQIIDPNLGNTDIGKVLLEADLQLKKDMARFTSPNTKEGRDYWNKLYVKAEQLYGRDDISVPTVTRPWIVPGEIMVRESKTSAYILKATLKVMLEQDYLIDAKNTFSDARIKELNEYSSDIIRSVILPKLTREVNSSKKYAGMRQAYYSLILAQWFKAHYRGTDVRYASRIDNKVLEGLTSQQPWSKDTYFKAYKKSFEQGEYNISETVSSAGGMTVRQYFSGGADFSGLKIGGIMDGGLLEDDAVRGLQADLVEATPAGKIINNPSTRAYDFPMDKVLRARSGDVTSGKKSGAQSAVAIVKQIATPAFNVITAVGWPALAIISFFQNIPIITVILSVLAINAIYRLVKAISKLNDGKQETVRDVSARAMRTQNAGHTIFDLSAYIFVAGELGIPVGAADSPLIWKALNALTGMRGNSTRIIEKDVHVVASRLKDTAALKAIGDLTLRDFEAIKVVEVQDGGINIVKLKNGSQETDVAVRMAMASLDNLYTSKNMGDILAFVELVRKARNPDHRISSPKEEKVLKDLAFLRPDGTIHATNRNIILSAVTGDGFAMALNSPLANDGGNFTLDGDTQKGFDILRGKGYAQHIATQLLKATGSSSKFLARAEFMPAVNAAADGGSFVLDDHTQRGFDIMRRKGYDQKTATNLRKASGTSEKFAARAETMPAINKGKDGGLDEKILEKQDLVDGVKRKIAEFEKQGMTQEATGWKHFLYRQELDLADLLEMKANEKKVTWLNGRVEKGKHYRLRESKSLYIFEIAHTFSPEVEVVGPSEEVLKPWYGFQRNNPVTGLYLQRAKGDGLQGDEPNAQEVFYVKVIMEGTNIRTGILVHVDELLPLDGGTPEAYAYMRSLVFGKYEDVLIFQIGVGQNYTPQQAEQRVLDLGAELFDELNGKADDYRPEGITFTKKELLGHEYMNVRMYAQVLMLRNNGLAPRPKKDGGLTKEEKYLHQAAVLKLYADRLKGDREYLMLNVAAVTQALEEILKLGAFASSNNADQAILDDIRNIVKQGPETLDNVYGDKRVVYGTMILLAAEILAKNNVQFTNEILESLIPLLNITSVGDQKKKAVGWVTVELILDRSEKAVNFLRDQVADGKLPDRDLYHVQEVLENKLDESGLTMVEVYLHQAAVLKLYAEQLKGDRDYLTLNVAAVTQALEEILKLGAFASQTMGDQAILDHVRNIVKQGPEILDNVNGDKRVVYGTMIFLAAQILAKNNVQFTDEILQALMPLLNVQSFGGSEKKAVGWQTVELIFGRGDKAVGFMRDQIAYSKLTDSDLRLVKKVLEAKAKAKKDGGLLSLRQERELLENTKEAIANDSSMSLFQQRVAMEQVERAVRNNGDVKDELANAGVLSVRQINNVAKTVKNLNDGGDVLSEPDYMKVDPSVELRWLENQLEYGDHDQRIEAVKALADVNDGNAVYALEGELKAYSTLIRRLAIQGLGIRGDRTVAPSLIAALGSEFAGWSVRNDKRVVRTRIKLVRTVGLLGHRDAVDVLITALETDPSDFVRAYAAYELGSIGDDRGREALLEIQYNDNESRFLRKVAANVLIRARKRFVISAESPQTPVDGGAPVKTGGIDFRALPVVSQPAVDPSVIAQGLAGMPMASAEEMDKNWAGIQKTMAQGQMPYAELKKFVTSCYAQKTDDKYRKAATQCVLNLLKLEEERAIATPDELKQIVILL